MGDFLSFLPSILGVVGSLFKGKKQTYAAQQTPQQQAAYSQLLKMLQARMGQPSAGMQPGNDAMNILYSQFLGRPYQPQMAGGPTAAPRIPATPMPSRPNRRY